MSKINLQRGKLTVENRKSREKKRICSGQLLQQCKKVKVVHTRLPSRVPELIPVLGSQPEGNVSHKSGSRLPLLSARPAVTPATLKRAATNFAAW